VSFYLLGNGAVLTPPVWGQGSPEKNCWLYVQICSVDIKIVSWFLTSLFSTNMAISETIKSLIFHPLCPVELKISLGGQYVGCQTSDWGGGVPP